LLDVRFAEGGGQKSEDRRGQGEKFAKI